MSRPAMKWWGWGAPEHRYSAPPGLIERLLGKLAAPPRKARPVEPSAPPRLPPARRNPFGSESITDDATRLQFASGRSYVDLIRLRSSELPLAPDAVLRPRDDAELRRILAQRTAAVVPFGGGTSVVGGVAPLRASHDVVVALEMSSFDQVLELDAKSQTVRVGAGMFGPPLEAELRKHGLTLAHFPQSFEYSTVGGWIAARSAGQESTRYGSIAENVVALRVITPSGDLRTIDVPSSATGPELREIFVGSEGSLGVIVDATLRLHRRPERRRYRSYLFRNFLDGVDCCRELLQSGVRPAVLRLSDEEETGMAFDLHSTPGSVRGVLKMLGRQPGAHLLLAFDGTARTLRAESALAYDIARRFGGFPLGASPGERWERERFEHPYLRDELLDWGLFVETFETAAPWSRLPSLYEAIARGVDGIVYGHVSHAYTDGASLYFTVIDDVPRGGEEDHWHDFKAKAIEIILANGGTISHHHGIGADHRPWLHRERGEAGMGLIRALKEQLDPAGIMNPEKLT